jgi:hypothetical protein
VTGRVVDVAAIFAVVWVLRAAAEKSGTPLVSMEGASPLDAAGPTASTRSRIRVAEKAPPRLNLACFGRPSW